MNRDKSEKLLACLEGIDDDIIAEAAQTVSLQPARKAKWQWFSLGNAAAVFVGAIAITCTLILAFWLSSAGPGGILPLPRIHGSGQLAILESGQTYMTINNPWHDTGHISELPVFRRHVVERYPGSGTPQDIQLTDEEWYQFIKDIENMGILIAQAAGIPADEIETAINHVYMSFRPAGLDRFLHKWMNSTLVQIAFPPGALPTLPANATLSETAPTGQVQAAIEYLAELFDTVIPMQTPTLTQAEIALDMGGPRTYVRQRFFDSGGSDLDALLAFNFGWVEVLSFDPGSPQWMYISLFPQGRHESLQLGNYPVITVEEAREMLLAGYFISERKDDEWPGVERAQEASAELIYYNQLFGTCDVIMPFYRFLLEVEPPLWWDNETPGEWRFFARYYVPAIQQDYLEPMTRRLMPQPR